MVVTEYKYVVIDENNVPVIKGTNMKVIELVLAQKGYGWSPDELHFQYPHVSLAQVYSALAYYADHREQIEKQIKDDLKELDELQGRATTSALAEKIRAHRASTNND